MDKEFKELFKEGDLNLEKIKKLEEYLKKEGFEYINNLWTNHITSRFSTLNSYECFVLIPFVTEFNEEAQKAIGKKYKLEPFTRVYGLKNNS